MASLGGQIDDMIRALGALRMRLAPITTLLTMLRAATPEPKPRRRGAAASPARQAQARYMTALRSVPKNKRAGIKRIRATKGTRAAITAAKRLRRP